MYTFESIVKDISYKFLKEARQSPQLLSDIAKMEYYMAESYSGRVFVELLQNADDANSSKVIVFQDKNVLYFANNGRVFDESDLIAISRSGNSKKKRGKTIGYRGVGFKSTSSISDDIIIFSNDTFFTFSKYLCAQLLNMKQEDVPTIRIPILLEDISDDIKQNIKKLRDKGYSTIFIFRKLKSNLFLNEMETINEGFFLFLKNIQECQMIYSLDHKVVYQIDRFVCDENQHIIVKSNHEEKEWLLINNTNTSVAFLIENNIIVPCSDDEAVYHCYLPTLDKSILPCKINANFSTDPSRKHLTLDDKTEYALKDVSNIFLQIMNTTVQNASETYKNIFYMVLNKNITSKINIFLNELIENNLTKNKWIQLNNGEKISPTDYKVFPCTFEVENIPNIRKVQSNLFFQSLPLRVYNNINCVEEFISQFSRKEFSLDEIIDVLSSKEFVENINIESYIQLLISVIRETRINSRFTNNLNLKRILIKTNTQEIVCIEELISSNKEIDKIIRQELIERLGNTELYWIQEQMGIKNLNQDINAKTNHKTMTNKNHILLNESKTATPYISKWRDAESKCIEIEEMLGNKAIDVSVKNVGYDIISTTAKGEKRYIEVKSVKKDLAFSLTNNEYTSAYEYGNNYYICLLCENEKTLDVRYIKNPLLNAKFEKRIRQWEWICVEYYNPIIHSFNIS